MDETVEAHRYTIIVDKLERLLNTCGSISRGHLYGAVLAGELEAGADPAIVDIITQLIQASRVPVPPASFPTPKE